MPKIINIKRHHIKTLGKILVYGSFSIMYFSMGALFCTPKFSQYQTNCTNRIRVSHIGLFIASFIDRWVFFFSIASLCRRIGKERKWKRKKKGNACWNGDLIVYFMSRNDDILSYMLDLFFLFRLISSWSLLNAFHFHFHHFEWKWFSSLLISSPFRFITMH